MYDHPGRMGRSGSRTGFGQRESIGNPLNLTLGRRPIMASDSRKSLRSQASRRSEESSRREDTESVPEPPNSWRREGVMSANRSGYFAPPGESAGGGAVLRGMNRGGGGSGGGGGAGSGGGGGGGGGRHPLVRAQAEAERQNNRLKSETNQLLKDDQNAEYEACIAADAEKRAARLVSEREAARAARQQEEDAQLNQTLAASTEEEKAASLARKRASLGPEPPAAAPAASAPASASATTTIRITLPVGKKLQRRFLPSDTLLSVRHFVDVSLADMAAAAAKVNWKNQLIQSPAGGEGAARGGAG